METVVTGIGSGSEDLYQHLHRLYICFRTFCTDRLMVLQDILPRFSHTQVGNVSTPVL